MAALERSIIFVLIILSAQASCCYSFQISIFGLQKRLATISQHARHRPLTGHQQTEEHSAVGDLPEKAVLLSFKYCSGCRWGMRSFWMAQELLTTFDDEPGLAAITLSPTKPPAPGGEFTVQSYDSISDELKTLWSFKDNGSFPEIKALKRIVRDVVNPTKSLGHSDDSKRMTKVGNTQEDVALGRQPVSSESSRNPRESISRVDTNQGLNSPLSAAPNLSISYCTACGLLLRAAWLAQELVSTTAEAESISSVTLIPIRSPTKDGRFIVSLDGRVIWDRTEQGGFPDVGNLIQLLQGTIPT